MTSLRIILALCLLSLFAAYAQADSPTYRVSVLAYANGSFDPVATDLITTSLSNQNELIVVERAELEILITEKTLEHLQSKVSRRAAQILGIDFFVFLEKASEETLATVRIVDASNSSLIGSKELLWNEENLLQKNSSR